MNSQQKRTLLSTLHTLASTARPLTYSVLIQTLGLPSASALESVIIEAIYTNLIEATLDPVSEIVHVTSIAPLDDLPAGSLPSLISTLQLWQSHCDDAISSVELQIRDIRAKSRAAKERRIRIEAMFERNLEDVEGDTGKKRAIIEGVEHPSVKRSR